MKIEKDKTFDSEKNKPDDEEAPYQFHKTNEQSSNHGEKANTNRHEENNNYNEIKIDDAVLVLSEKEKNLRKKEKILNDMYDHAYTVEENDIVVIRIPDEKNNDVVISPLEKRRKKIWYYTLVGVYLSIVAVSAVKAFLVL